MSNNSDDEYENNIIEFPNLPWDYDEYADEDEEEAELFECAFCGGTQFRLWVSQDIECARCGQMIGSLIIEGADFE